jgi:integrase
VALRLREACSVDANLVPLRAGPVPQGLRRPGSIERPEAQRWAKAVPYFQYRTVRTMFADARRDGLVSANPFSELRIPVPEGRRRIAVLSENGIVALADKALEVHGEDFGPTMRSLVLVSGFVGLRPSECGGLEWTDLREGHLTVRRALGAKGNMGPPKNGEPRLCVVPPPARDALAVVPRFVDQPAVFLTPRLKRFSKGAIHRYFGVVRAAYGRAELDFYELRHACATLLLERGLAGGRRDPARPHRRRHPGQQALRPPIRGACAGQDRGGVCSRTGRKLVAGVEKPPSSRRFACSKLTLSADAPAVHLAAVATRNGVGG